MQILNDNSKKTRNALFTNIFIKTRSERIIKRGSRQEEKNKPVCSFRGENNISSYFTGKSDFGSGEFGLQVVSLQIRKIFNLRSEHTDKT